MSARHGAREARAVGGGLLLALARRRRASRAAPGSPGTSPPASPARGPAAGPRSSSAATTAPGSTRSTRAPRLCLPRGGLRPGRRGRPGRRRRRGADAAAPADAGPDGPPPAEDAGRDAAPDVPGPTCAATGSGTGRAVRPRGAAGHARRVPDGVPRRRGLRGVPAGGRGRGLHGRCLTDTITAVGPLEGCCPEGAGPEDDRTARTTAATGAPAERALDPASAGRPRALPDELRAAVRLRRLGARGDGGDCSARCRLTAITTVGPADGCCPDPQAFGADPDCEDPCGDGVLQAFEGCDRGIAEGRSGAVRPGCPADEPCRSYASRAAPPTARRAAPSRP